MEGLKACPFCGEQPLFVKVSRQSKRCMVICNNPNCGIRPESSAGTGYSAVKNGILAHLAGLVLRIGRRCATNFVTSGM